MELQLSQKSFKSQAKKLHAAVKDRGIDCKLSDIQESLALSFGYANLATLYATFKAEDARYVHNRRELLKQASNLFIIGWRYPEGDALDEQLAVYRPGITYDQIATRNQEVARAAKRDYKFFPDGLVLSEQTVVLENYAEVPRIDKYGLDDSVNEARIEKYVFSCLGFRVPIDGVDINIHDTGDDSASKNFFQVWVPDDDAARIHELFAK